MPTRCLALLLACGIILGCGSADETRPSFEIESFDSAGVHIIVNRGANPADSTQWQVLAEPRFTIAGEHPEIGGLYGLLPDGSAVRLATGAMVVANASGSELAYIRPDGTPITVVTSVGGGPREYRRIDRVAPHPEGGVGVWDRSRGRILVYDSLGTFLRAIEVATPAGQPGWAFMSNGGLRGFLGDGSFVMLSELRLDEEAAVVRHRYVVTIHTDDGSRAAVVDSLAGPELHRSGGPGPTFAEAPFDALPDVLVTNAEIRPLIHPLHMCGTCASLIHGQDDSGPQRTRPAAPRVDTAREGPWPQPHRLHPAAARAGNRAPPGGRGFRAVGAADSCGSRWPGS